MHDFCFTYPYGAAVLGGGLLGYLRRGSVASLAGGLAAGSLLILSAKLSLDAYRRRSNSHPALLLQTAVAAALTWIMGQRYLLTGKVMPAAVVSALSAVMSLFYIYKLLRGGNHFPSTTKQAIS